MGHETIKSALAASIENKFGVAITSETKESVKRARESYMLADEVLFNEHITDLSLHSDACMSEIEFVQGIVSEDPHPEHKVVFSSSASDASRLL